MKRPDPTRGLPVLRALSSAVNYRSLYPASHPRVVGGVEKLIDELNRYVAERGTEEMTFLLIDEELVIDDRPIRAGRLYLGALIRTMQGLGVERLTLAAGLTEEESHRLIEGLATIGDLESTPHVVLGRVRLGDQGAASEHDDSGTETRDKADLSERDLDELEESFRRYSTDRSGAVGGLDRMLWHFVEGIDRSSRSLLLLGPMRSLDQKLFVHSVNVSLLVMAQARSIGITGQNLHAVGMAAMLHDIGKLSLPRPLLEREGDLSDVEWEIVKMHTVLGAAQLCSLPEATPLAVLVAYEHHLRWDGKPSYPIPSVPRRPNLASQLTAIADTYDVMVERPGFSGGVHGETATRVWRERSETFLDPFLVGNFILMIAQAEDGGPRFDAGFD